METDVLEKGVKGRAVASEALFSKERGYQRGKRIFDIGFSLLVLLFLSPVFLCIAIGIMCASKGDVIFTQERVGRLGKIFKCYKFRTMHSDAEKKLAKLLKENPLLKKEWERNQKIQNDPRIFSFGKFLRKTSLDELPQFFNVLKGDLSVVGPRPYMTCQLKDMGKLAAKILNVKPGITGIWQTGGRSRTTFQQRVRMDAEYEKKSSFWFDLGLILKTIPIIIFSKNAC